MLNQVILLTTDVEDDYWHKPKTAKFWGKVRYTDLPNWNILANSCPLAGLGIYYQKRRDCSRIPFVYIKIKEMSYDSKTGNPFFDFDVIGVSSTQSDTLRRKLPLKNQLLISTIEIEDLLRVLNEIGEKAPEEWLHWATDKALPKPSLSWRDYLGNYFWGLEHGTLSNNEFEDRIAFLLRALGFKVTQKGYTVPGPYADGVALHEDIGVVYDCKNSQTYTPIESDIRALKQYTNDEATLHSGKTLYSAFISRDFQTPSQQDISHLRVEPLLYLLTVELIRGSEFNLNPFKLILQKRRELNRQTIDEYWRP